jgi:hypothetical protein
LTTCTKDAMRLIKKPDARLYLPPETGAETFVRLATERGKNLMPEG